MSKNGGTPRRIMIVVDSLDVGGTQRFAVVASDALTARGLDVILVVHSPSLLQDAYSPTEATTVVRLNQRWDGRSRFGGARSLLRSTMSLRDCIGRHSPDAVLALGTTMSVLLLMTLRRSPLVAISERTNPAHEMLSWIWRVGRRTLYRHADVLLVQTQEVAEVCEAWIPKKRIRVIGNIAPDHLFERRWTPSSRQNVVAVGRLFHYKGFDTLIAAFKHVVNECPDANLTIYGDGPDREKLLSLVRLLDLERSVHFPGSVDDPFNAMESASVFVLSSNYEGFPNALLEAMAIGVPVVSTDCPSGPRDMITDRLSGRLTPVGSPLALAQAIVELLQDEGLAQQMGSEARKSASRFRPAVIVEDLVEALRAENNRRA